MRGNDYTAFDFALQSLPFLHVKNTEDSTHLIKSYQWLITVNSISETVIPKESFVKLDSYLKSKLSEQERQKAETLAEQWKSNYPLYIDLYRELPDSP
jgi:hypothetical protein